ncbi:MAG: adenylate/guanylate cyclase domain-containing protein [Polyangiaceae bacterium]
MLRLHTVRQKLIALVGLSLIVIVAALLVLRWVLHEQVRHEAASRVENAGYAFEDSVDEQIGDLDIVAHVLGTSTGVKDGIQKNDPAKVTRIAQRFFDAYPNMDMLFVAPDGKIVAQLGCEDPPSTIDPIQGMNDVVHGKAFRGLIDHGCAEPGDKVPPAFAIGMPLDGGGAIVLCLPYSVGLFEEAAKTLHMQLSLVSPADKIISSTAKYPVGAHLRKSPNLTVVHFLDAWWLSGRFRPKNLSGPQGAYTVVAALDITELELAVRRNLLLASLFIGLAALISIAAAWRMASTMSNALTRVSLAHRKLQDHAEYTHVEGVTTGDELEELADGFNAMVEGLKERDRMRNTFGKYMTASVMEHLLSGKVQPGGELLPVTILFSDIRSFTTISENMDAKALVALLNEYFSEMVGIVMQEDGVVDKYIGDAIMAVFGAPVPRADDAKRAVKAAVRMRTALANLNVSLKSRGMQTLRTGIGIHTGEVVAGNLGSEKRMEYTVIGDAVNLASRLESATKELGVNVLISEDTYVLTKDVIEAKPVKEIHVKGRGKPVMTYEVLGIKGEELLPKDVV